MPTLEEEISRRRTFAIISHPDAGKTTLTEKFLLYGGAIAQAGEVKGKRAKAATSDWMEIEKQRGISVTSSVMQFQHNGFCINITDQFLYFWTIVMNYIRKNICQNCNSLLSIQKKIHTVFDIRSI